MSISITTKSFFSSAQSLAYGDPSGSFPTGARAINVTFSDGRAATKLHYAILLNDAANETSVTGQQGQGVSVSPPGSVIQADCSTPENMGVTEVLSGTVSLDSHGVGSIIVVGTLMNQHAYLTHGSNDVVNVLQIVPPVTDIAPPGHIGQGCILRLPGWKDLGPKTWYAPADLTGTVTIGAVGGKYSLESSNPALANLSSLSWQLNGPTAFNYSLTNNEVVQREGEDLFWAGVLAAFAAALILEAVKASADLGEVIKNRDAQTVRAEENVDVADASGAHQAVSNETATGRETSTHTRATVGRLILAGFGTIAVGRLIRWLAHRSENRTDDPLGEP
jgi:hypothetical protein